MGVIAMKNAAPPPRHVLAALLIAAGTPAAAMQVTETEVFTLLGNTTQQLSFDRFEETLGTLTAVSLTVLSRYDVDIEAEAPPSADYNQGESLIFGADLRFRFAGDLGSAVFPTSPLPVEAGCTFSTATGCPGVIASVDDSLDLDLLSELGSLTPSNFDFTNVAFSEFDLQLSFDIDPRGECRITGMDAGARCRLDRDEWFGEMTLVYQFTPAGGGGDGSGVGGGAGGGGGTGGGAGGGGDASGVGGGAGG
ncbi:MAG: choice-of-anchor E domain-containing protein, partial [Pseudomonadota bacterium]